MSEELFGVVQVGLGLAGAGALVWAGATVRRGRRVLAPVLVLVLCGGALALVAVSRSRAAGVAACSAELNRLGSALELYAQSNGGQSPPALDYLVPFYFEELPACPVVPSGQPNPYQQGYQGGGTAFTVLCRGRHHRGLGGCGSDFPRFSPESGVQTAP